MTIWRPGPFSGAPMGSCGCGCSGFGAAGPPRRYPNIEQTLRDYIAQKAANSQYFWISPALNTATLRQSTFGDMSTVLDTSGMSPTLGPTSAGSGTDAVVNLASTIGDFFSSVLGNSASDVPLTTTDPTSGYTSWLNDISSSANSYAPVVNSLPSDLKAPVANAAQMDLFGVPVSPWVVAGGAALALVAIAALAMPKKGGRRRR